MKKIAIGGGQGFWGDSPDAAIHMIRHADIQYMGCDYLAELTLSIMAKQQLKDPSKGFAPDFVTRILKEAGKEAWQKGVRITTDAGGMNVSGCVEAIRNWAESEGMKGYRIGYVTGDSIKDKIPQLLKDGWTFPNFDYDGNFNDIVDKIYNCNAYIGHEGIEACIADRADVVVTGRAADSALFLAPLKYEFGWAADDWDNLARGIMAGHLLECGGQGAGGNYMYDWRGVPSMDELGFPIAELTEDSMEITKAPDCGGIICEQSVKEQFVYEVLDPANYMTPDVNVDISHASLKQLGDNRVRVSGIKGKQRPDTLKLCVGYHKGWKTVSMLSFAWPDAYEKAKYCGEVIMKRMKRLGMKADDIHISYIGLNSLHLNVADMSEESIKNLNECVLRIAVFSEDKNECAKIIPEISPMQLNGPPGASFFGGRAHVQEVMALWPTTVPRDALQIESHILEV
ncbi:MAG: acyclic terpene utilization AtuA family protein [Eubacteriales bacterium]|nr:acyclic terpene utilization AtuA family protein [Eubacteriales bacterium]